MDEFVKQPAIAIKVGNIFQRLLRNLRKLLGGYNVIPGENRTGQNVQYDGQASSMNKQTKNDHDFSHKIAQRISDLRRELGLSLDQLANKSEVSKSMLSLIERGESSPTAVVLGKIATALKVSLPDLFELPNGIINPVSKSKERETWKDPESGYQRTNISPENFPSPVKIAEVILPAGAKVTYESAFSGFHQQIWIQEGSMEVSLGSVTHKLDQGDCLAMTLELPTMFRNRSKKNARYYVVIIDERYRSSTRKKA